MMKVNQSKDLSLLSGNFGNYPAYSRLGRYCCDIRGVILEIFGFIPLITGLIGFYPLYALFKTKRIS